MMSMYELGRRAAQSTDPDDRETAWRGGSHADTVETIVALGEADDQDYPTTKKAVAEFKRGILSVLGKTPHRKNPAGWDVIVGGKGGFVVNVHARLLPTLSNLIRHSIPSPFWVKYDAKGNVVQTNISSLVTKSLRADLFSILYNNAEKELRRKVEEDHREHKVRAWETRQNPTLSKRAYATMYNLGKEAVLTTPKKDRQEQWGGCSIAGAREAVNGLSDIDECDYPTTKAALQAFLAGVQNGLEA